MQFKIFSIGEAGAAITNSLVAGNFEKERLFYFDTDRETISRVSISNKFHLGKGIHGGKGVSGKVTIAREIFMQDVDLIRRLTSDDVLYIITGGLGGATFEGIASELSRILHASDRKFIVVATYPYPFEGSHRGQKALDTVQEINHYTDRLILVNDPPRDQDVQDSSIEEIFLENDNRIRQVIRELVNEFKNAGETDRPFFADRVEQIISNVKKWIEENEYLIAKEDSKIILPDTNYQLLQVLHLNPDFVYSISPRKFEELVEYIYKLAGCETQLTKATRDHGVDLLVWTPPPVLGNKFLTVIQAKQYDAHRKVGESSVTQLLGSRFDFKAEKAQLVTSSDYSKPAIQTAKRHKIDLIKFYELTNTIKDLISEQ